MTRTDSSPKSKLSGVRVLAVDDDPENLSRLRSLLIDEGAHVTAVGTAAEALTAAQMSGFDLLVFDMILPGMRGDELLRAVRTVNTRLATTPALAVTGYGSMENQGRVLRAGFRASLYKPLDPTRFIRIAADALGTTG